MAGTTVTAPSISPTWSAEYRAIAELNKVIADLETLRAALSSGGVTAVTELMADHATFKVTVDQLETLAEELGADHATFKVTVDQLEALAEELAADHATNKTLLDELKADYNLLRLNFVNSCSTAVGLAEGTDAATIKTAATAQYQIGGQRYTKAATDNIAVTATAEQAISTFCMYLVSVVANGDVTVTKGTELGTDAAVLPALPANSAPIGAFKIATDGVTTFTGGTTDLGAAGITDTYYDLAYVNSGADAATEVAASSAATLSATTAITSGPATLTAAIAITSGPATLSASAPSATAVDEAGDMTAAVIESTQFEAEIV